jgi:hypothetical protein
LSMFINERYLYRVLHIAIPFIYTLIQARDYASITIKVSR